MLLLSISFLVNGANGADHRIDCPSKLEVGTLAITHPPAGWTPFVSSFVRLNSAGPMDGPPALMAVLKEDVYIKRGQKTVTKWTWGKDDGNQSYPDGKWMACNYGAENGMILSKSIDDAASECTVTYTDNKSGQPDIEIHCQW